MSQLSKIFGCKETNPSKVPVGLSWWNLYKQKKARVAHPESYIRQIKYKKSTLVQEQ